MPPGLQNDIPTPMSHGSQSGVAINVYNLISQNFVFSIQKLFISRQKESS
jgi:hypothetical protein